MKIRSETVEAQLRDWTPMSNVNNSVSGIQRDGSSCGVFVAMVSLSILLSSLSMLQHMPYMPLAVRPSVSPSHGWITQKVVEIRIVGPSFYFW